jgi:hypothetical protein
MERCGMKVQVGSHIHIPGSEKKCEGMGPHIPKWTLTLGVGIFTKS